MDNPQAQMTLPGCPYFANSQKVDNEQSKSANPVTLEQQKLLKRLSIFLKIDFRGQLAALHASTHD